ncbi:MAG: formylmethanofuran dehydrogenase subunit C [Gemmataceae bacterium]|nr:formylmethanofuran dehydrogenase subunit C [Gemmataceae bacterium]
MIVLRLKNHSGIPLEADCVTPDLFQGKSLSEVGALEVLDGNRKAPLGEFFEISGEASDGRIQIQGDCSRVKWIGSGMTFGEVHVDGNAGMHSGSAMKGGKLEIHGNSSDWLGAEMRGGVIHVRGNTGHLCGAAYRGGSKGMRGGTILIEGNAGNETAAMMRRGLVGIRGNVGDFAGMGMIAGTLVVGGEVGIRTGAEMKRGTLVFLNHLPKLLPTFRYSCDYRPGFLQLYFSRLKSLGFPIPGSDSQIVWKRYCGDLLTLGLGEILVPAKAN